jgi:hypothetical protein
MPPYFAYISIAAPCEVVDNTLKVFRLKPEQRVVLHIFIVQNLVIMSNLKRALENQQSINEAVEAIFDYFSKDCSYAEALETIADAQIAIMELMEISNKAAMNPALDYEFVSAENIKNFLFEANNMCKLLRPFAKLLGQVYGAEH